MNKMVSNKMEARDDVIGRMNAWHRHQGPPLAKALHHIPMWGSLVLHISSRSALPCWMRRCDQTLSII